VTKRERLRDNRFSSPASSSEHEYSFCWHV
jgi:hypothetical protein